MTIRTCKVRCWHSCFCVALLVASAVGVVVASKVFSMVSPLAPARPYLTEKLLGTKYNNVVFATTHNSYAVFGQFSAANHFGSIQNSLDQGVRALMLDVHWSDHTSDGIAICHSRCSQGSVRVDEILGLIATFLDNHPVNVITIMWEIVCSKQQEDCDALKHAVYRIIERSQLADMLYVPTNASPADGLTPTRVALGDRWPTLQKMVDNNERIVMFFDKSSDKSSFDRPSHLELWDHVIETSYSNNDHNALDAECKFHRGSPDNPGKMLLNNHFTHLGLLPVSLITMGYNTNPYMYNRMVRCQHELGKPITNFISVDHWWYSDVVNTAACLNGEHDAETCKSGNTVRTVFKVAISIMGGGIGILAIHVCLKLYRRLSNTGEILLGHRFMQEVPTAAGPESDPAAVPGHHGLLFVGAVCT